MKVMVVEDEPRAANRLIRMIKAQMPAAEIVAQIASVKEALSWFDVNSDPDLIFMDVRLEDGDSFEILSSREISSPIIFCTAYSEYALAAFDANSIDYLLKPVNEEKLARALKKYAHFVGFRMEQGTWRTITEQQVEASYKKRLMVPHGRKLVMVEVDQIMVMEAYLKGTKVIDAEGREWVLDEPLSTLETLLDPNSFFRISRQTMVQLPYIDHLHRDGTTVSVTLHNWDGKYTVSRSRVRSLKDRLKS